MCTAQAGHDHDDDVTGAAVVLHKSVHVCMLAAGQKSCSKASLQATS